MDVLRNVFYVILAILSFSDLTVLFLTIVSFYLSVLMALFFIISIVIWIIKRKQSKENKKSMKIYIVTMIVSGAIYYACFLYLNNFQQHVFPSVGIKNVSVSIPTGLKVDFSK